MVGAGYELRITALCDGTPVWEQREAFSVQRRGFRAQPGVLDVHGPRIQRKRVSREIVDMVPGPPVRGTDVVHTALYASIFGPHDDDRFRHLNRVYGRLYVGPDAPLGGLPLCRGPEAKVLVVAECSFSGLGFGTVAVWRQLAGPPERSNYNVGCH